MKRIRTIALLFALASMTGCLVCSLHPYFKPGDKFHDPVLVGNWIDGDSCIWTIEANKVSEHFMGPEQMDSTYRIVYYEDEDSKAVLTGTLFQLNEIPYVDFMPDQDEDQFNSDMAGFHHIPVHTLARIRYSRDSILIYWYGEEWLNDLFEQNRIRIQHETIKLPGFSRHVLTASTEELQKFIRKYASDPRTTEDIETFFTHGTTDEESESGVFLTLKPYDGPIPSGKARQVKPE